MSRIKERFNTICHDAIDSHGSQPSPWLSETMNWVSSNSKRLFFISSLSLCCTGVSIADTPDIVNPHTVELGKTYLQAIIPDINVVVGRIQDLAIENSETHAEVNMHNFQKNASQSSLSAAVLSDNVHFNKQHSDTSGPITCYLSVNDELFKEDFKSLKQYSKLSDDKLLDLYARHELSHCMKDGLSYKALTNYGITGDSSHLDEPALSSSFRKTASSSSRDLLIVEENNNDYAVQITEIAPGSVLEIVSDEIYADSMALVSAYVDSVITKEDAYDYLNIRKSDYAEHGDETHNTFDSAKALFDAAIVNPKLIALKAIASTNTQDNIITVSHIVTDKWFEIVNSPEFIEKYDVDSMSLE